MQKYYLTNKQYVLKYLFRDTSNAKRKVCILSKKLNHINSLYFVSSWSMGNLPATNDVKQLLESTLQTSVDYPSRWESMFASAVHCTRSLQQRVLFKERTCTGYTMWHTFFFLFQSNIWNLIFFFSGLKTVYAVHIIWPQYHFRVNWNTVCLYV